MRDFNTEFLKNVAARVATQFLTNQKPLSNGVAEVAAEYSLAPEQIKRLVEVANQVTYLKLLPTADDRTFEFDVARYEDVLGMLTAPESVDMTDELSKSPLDIVAGPANEGLDKVASEEVYQPSDQEKTAYISKHIYAARKRLEKIAEREILILDEIPSVIRECKSDESFMVKAAMVTDGEEELLSKVAMLVYGTSQSAVEEEGLFYDHELDKAKQAVGLLKEASELVEERKTLESQLEKAAFAVPALASALKSGANRAGTLANRALGVAEPVGFALDSKPKKNAWKSLQGPRAQRRNNF